MRSLQVGLLVLEPLPLDPHSGGIRQINVSQFAGGTISGFPSASFSCLRSAVVAHCAGSLVSAVCRTDLQTRQCHIHRSGSPQRPRYEAGSKPAYLGAALHQLVPFFLSPRARNGTIAQVAEKQIESSSQCCWQSVERSSALVGVGQVRDYRQIGIERSEAVLPNVDNFFRRQRQPMLEAHQRSVLG